MKCHEHPLHLQEVSIKGLSWRELSTTYQATPSQRAVTGFACLDPIVVPLVTVGGFEFR